MRPSRRQPVASDGYVPDMASDQRDLDQPAIVGRPSPKGAWRRAPVPGLRSGHDRSAGSVSSWCSAGSVSSGLSVASVGSFLSIGCLGSAGSILSIGSAGSILSIGSAGSILSIGSSGSILSVGSVRVGGEGTEGRAIGASCTVLAVAALLAAALER